MAEIRAPVLINGLLQMVSAKIPLINKDKARNLLVNIKDVPISDFPLLELMEIVDVVYNGYRIYGIKADRLEEGRALEVQDLYNTNDKVKRYLLFILHKYLRKTHYIKSINKYY
jgi:hypothetical protein